MEDHEPWPEAESQRSGPRPNPPCNAHRATHTAPPSNLDPQLLARDAQPHSASSWRSDPDKAQLRRQMGIGADLDCHAQELETRNFRQQVRGLAGIDFSKTWTELKNEGKTEAMT